jgi:HK97 gp10 family phage protein
MPDGVTVNITGLDELALKLGEQAQKAARKALRNAGNRAGAVVQAAIEKNAPRLTGFLAEHVVIKTVIKDSDLFVTIGPQAKAGYFVGGHRSVDSIAFEGKPHYAEVSARMAEFGSRHQAAYPFVRPAFEETKEPALAVFVDELWNSLRDLEEK